MLTIARVRRDADLPCFVTLTYPYDFPTAKESKPHLHRFIERMSYHFPEVGEIWKLEPQLRDAPHYHMLVWGVELDELRAFVPTAWFDIAGGGDPYHLKWHRGEFRNQHCVQKVRSFKGVLAYASKYLGKTFEVNAWGKNWTGRYWGVVHPENIPFGKFKAKLVTHDEAVKMMRLQRKFVKSNVKEKKKINRRAGRGRSYTIFCDASQWAERLVPDIT